MPNHHITNKIDKKQRIHQIILISVDQDKILNRSFKSSQRKISNTSEIETNIKQNVEFNTAIEPVSHEVENNICQPLQPLDSVVIDTNTQFSQTHDQIRENIPQAIKHKKSDFHFDKNNRSISFTTNLSTASVTQRDTSIKRHNKIHHRKKVTEKQEKRRRRCCGFYWPCSPCCTLCWIIGAIILLAAVAALIVALLTNKSKTTTILSTAFITTITTSTSTDTTTTESSTMTTTYTSTTTTTTRSMCNASCLNQSWIDFSNTMAKWQFEGSFTNLPNNYSIIPSSSVPTFITEGYVGQAISFDATLHQYLYTSYIPLRNISFTVDAWIYQNGMPNPTDYNIVGMCPSMSTRNCLQIGIRSQKLYFSFWLPDSTGVTTIQTDQWLHTAFVFDQTTNTMTTYLNGFPDQSLNTNQSLLCSTGNFTIGINALIRPPNNTFQGYIDNLSVTGRAKSSCEVLEIATLAARFHFDNISSLDDFGPNQVDKSALNYVIISGFINEAISFSGTSTSYFQTWGFTSFGIMNKAFSFAFWIKPQLLSGTLIHLSTSSLGTGTTCFPLLAFASNGSIVAQVLLTNGIIVSAIGPLLPTSSSSWISIVQTWSSNNGLKLYINNTLVSSAVATTFLTSNSTMNYLTLGNCLNGCSSCTNGLIVSPGSFSGAIDEWLVFSRELNEDDVCAHFNAR
ncbi:unnamed protein product [Adineta steineri]|uniref:LamG-like jellyroll fold domain-containing protein n=1 Tax=Adineta steineri TaxID=433720 RepID=A0A815Z4E9_9BILA|nr:unnamed protein product [Adineta steineri]CAF1578503.1 unnamed protein product [Adineta steineri]